MRTNKSESVQNLRKLTRNVTVVGFSDRLLTKDSSERDIVRILVRRMVFAYEDPDRGSLFYISSRIRLDIRYSYNRYKKET